MAYPVPIPGPAARRRGRGRLHARAGLEAVLGRAGVVALCGALAVESAAPGVLRRAAVPVAVAGILLGIPHGAVDHMVPFWLDRRRPRWSGIARVLAGYLLVTGAAAAAFRVVPTAAFAVFLAASLVHFGRGEVQFAAERAGSAPARRDEQWLRTLAHGGTVVVLPFAIWPDQVRAGLTALAPPLASAALRPLWVSLGALVAALAMISIGADLQAGRLREAAESTLLLTAALALPPLVFFGIYFGAWHAARHTGRLLTIPGPDGKTLTPAASLRRYARHAAAPTAAVAVALAVLLTVRSSSVLGVAVPLLLALTFPHMRVVARWDRQAAGALSPSHRTDCR